MSSPLLQGFDFQAVAFLPGIPTVIEKQALAANLADALEASHVLKRALPWPP